MLGKKSRSGVSGVVIGSRKRLFVIWFFYFPFLCHGSNRANGRGGQCPRLSMRRRGHGTRWHPFIPLLPLLLLCLCVGESPAQGPPVVFVGVFLGCSACAILQGTRLAGSRVNLGHACGCVNSRDLDPYDLELIYCISLICLYISLSINLSVFISIYLFIYLSIHQTICLSIHLSIYISVCSICPRCSRLICALCFFLCGIEILCWSRWW